MMKQGEYAGAVTRHMARLVKQTERLNAPLSDVKFSNCKERTEQIAAFLGQVHPGR